MTGADVAAYHEHFPRRRATITGEWTGRYMFDAWTPPLLRRAAPDAKLLVMLSDPIERYRAIFADRLAKRADGRARSTRPTSSTAAASARSCARLRRFYDRDRILVLQYERCRRDPVEQYRRTLAFLGVRDTGFVPRRLRPQGRRQAGIDRRRRRCCGSGCPWARAAASPSGWRDARSTRGGRPRCGPTSRPRCTRRWTPTWRRCGRSCPSST